MYLDVSQINLKCSEYTYLVILHVFRHVSPKGVTDTFWNLDTRDMIHETWRVSLWQASRASVSPQGTRPRYSTGLWYAYKFSLVCGLMVCIQVQSSMRAYDLSCILHVYARPLARLARRA